LILFGTILFADLHIITVWHTNFSPSFKLSLSIVKITVLAGVSNFIGYLPFKSLRQIYYLYPFLTSLK